MSKPDVSTWLRDETGGHLGLLTELQTKLATSIDSETNRHGTPSREWCRALERFQASFGTLLAEQRERLALRARAARAGEEFMTEAEYATELDNLAVESLSTLPDEALHRELERRSRLLAKENNHDD